MLPILTDALLTNHNDRLDVLSLARGPRPPGHFGITVAVVRELMLFPASAPDTDCGDRDRRGGDGGKVQTRPVWKRGRISFRERVA